VEDTHALHITDRKMELLNERCCGDIEEWLTEVHLELKACKRILVFFWLLLLVFFVVVFLFFLSWLGT